MRTSRFRRFWAVTVILAIALATVSHAIAMSVAGQPIVPATTGDMSKMGGCTGCGDHKLMPMANCATPFCSVLPSTELGGLVAFPAEPTLFFAFAKGAGPGIAPAPDPYPPRP